MLDYHHRFSKYLKQFRPSEYDLAMSFYKENLNRMTVNQLKQYIKIAGFEQIMFFPNIYIENYFEINEKIFVESKNNYPSLELIDLVSPALYIGLKKPILSTFYISNFKGRVFFHSLSFLQLIFNLYKLILSINKKKSKLFYLRIKPFFKGSLGLIQKEFFPVRNAVPFYFRYYCFVFSKSCGFINLY